MSRDEARLASGVSVVGVSVGDQHRAYPLYVLKNHQVVNDRVGDVPAEGLTQDRRIAQLLKLVHASN